MEDDRVKRGAAKSNTEKFSSNAFSSFALPFQTVGMIKFMHEKELGETCFIISAREGIPVLIIDHFFGFQIVCSCNAFY